MTGRSLQIGISGITSADAIERLIAGIGVSIPEGMTLRLGVSCSHHGLMKKVDPRGRPNLFVSPENVKEVLARTYRGVSIVIHYSSWFPGDPASNLSLRDQISLLLDNVGNVVDGIQLNDIDSTPEDLRLIRENFPDLELTVPITGTMQREIVKATVQSSQFSLLEMADFVLLDASAGRGMPLSTELVAACLERLDDWGLKTGRILAGGLGPGLGDLIGDLAKSHRFGVDAEGKLRREDVLQIDLAVAYVRDSIALLSAM